MMKIVFSFILKALFVLKIFTFCADFLEMQKNDLIRNLSSISKLMTSQTRQQITTIHILPNKSRSKVNQAMKLDQ